MSKLFLFDIEGTTTDIHFVHKVLFPYSQACLREYILNHQSDPLVKNAINSVIKTVYEEQNKETDLHGAIETLQKWINEDRKHGALKEIQGLIWDLGYSKNAFKGHVYPDVPAFFRKILDKGNKIGIYSSGSVHAQKLIFGFSILGDLTPMISYYFDTNIGAKREKIAYENISVKVGLRPAEIHFFSDTPEELLAAHSAGLKVTQVSRSNLQASDFDIIPDFNSLGDSL